jgi:signal transduction histidine kinase
MAAALLKNNKVYILIISFLVLLFIASAVISPILIKYTEQNWEKNLIDKTDALENSVNEAIDKKYGQLIEVDHKLKNDLMVFVNKDSIDRKGLFNIVLDQKYKNYNVQLFRSDKELLCWNSGSVLEESDLPNIQSWVGQTFFSKNKLFIYLSFLDTVKTNKDTLFIVSSLLFRKYHSLSDKEQLLNNFPDSVSEELSTGIKFDCYPLAELSKDGRRHSFLILNNFKNKIGVVSFDKPSIEIQLNNIRHETENIQNMLCLAAFLITGIWSRRLISKINPKAIRFVIVVLYICLLRTLLFYIRIPSSFIRNSLTDPANYSSAFCFGIVGSPLELFISCISLFIIVVLGYRYSIGNNRNKAFEIKKNPLKFLLLTITCTILYLTALRGFGASIRSVVFDSTIRYFKDFSLLPSPPVILMEFNILLLGLCSVIFSVILLYFIFIYSGSNFIKGKYFGIGVIFILFQATSWIYDVFQNEPQGTPLIRVIYITLTFILTILLYHSKGKSKFVLLYYTLAASVISLSLLTYYNSEIERESLKTTAGELTRTNQSVVEFMVFQTLVQVQQNQNIKEVFKDKKDLSSEIFLLWNKSLFYREGIRSAIYLYDRGLNYLGGFETNRIFSSDAVKHSILSAKDSLKIFNQVNAFTDEITFIGVAPIYSDKQIIGYVSAAALYDEDYFNYAYLPEFLIPPRAGFSSALDLEKLKIFDFHNSELRYSYGNLSLTSEEEKELLNTKINNLNEAWLKTKIGNEKYIVYITQIKNSSNLKTIAIALEEKRFSWNLSDFFKIFFIHSLFILSCLIIYISYRYRYIRQAFSSFKTKLVAWFLLISLVPLFIIAVYFKNLSDEKNKEFVETYLTDITQQIESYLTIYLNNSSVNPEIVFEKASHDLGVDYSIYSGNKNIYDSQENLNKAGLLPSLIAPEPFSNLWLGKDQKFFLINDLEGIHVNSVYSFIRIDGKDYIICVNDMFNNISLSLSGLDLDIFLFGIFSLSVLLLIAISTFLANQFSSPIVKLTNATRTVGSGDLNVEVISNSGGEIKDLIDGFNMMVTRIRKSQSDLARIERETAWKEMAKQVAHEIKNPLTPMKLSIQQLIAAYKDKSPKFDSIFERVTSTIISQVETLKNIASEFSNFARMPLLNIERLNLITSVKEAIDLFETEKQKIEFIYIRDVVNINADNDQLKRTIINLIRNSIQASAGKIRIEIIVDGDICKLYIHDDGKGINPEIIQRIFDQNFTTKNTGMGLGLSMSKKFIDNIGGNIVVEKTSSSGTTFLIILPVIE